MTNIDKAADLLYQRSKELLGAGSDAAHRACQEHAQALADAGLLKTEFEESELSRLFGLETAVERAIRKGWVDEREFEDFL